MVLLRTVRVSGNDSGPNVTQTRTYNFRNQITGIDSDPEWEAPEYDLPGNMTAFTNYSGNENLDAGYDAWGHMVWFGDSGGVNAYVYDALGRRIVHGVYDFGRRTDYWFKADGRMVQEYKDDFSTVTNAEYVWSPFYVDELVLRDRDTNGQNPGMEERLYAQQDALYNVTAILDTSGTVLERYRYSAYGDRSYLDADFEMLGQQYSATSAYDWSIASQGLTDDNTTGLLYNRARWRHVKLGSFTQMDPSGYPDGLNAYAMLRANPVGGVDPQGLWKINRNGTSTAVATSDEGDTIADLAAIIGLDAANWSSWLTVSAAGLTARANPATRSSTAPATGSSVGARTPLCAAQTVQVPNTILMFWTGELGGFGRSWVRWDSQAEWLRAGGFDVVEQLNDGAGPWTGAQFLQWLSTSSGAKELHGLVVWGHGWRGGFSDKNPSRFQVTYKEAVAHLRYTLGLVVLNVCEGGWSKATNNGLEGGRDLVASNGEFWGVTKTLYPITDSDFAVIYNVMADGFHGSRTHPLPRIR
jgi:RHS repeat-associated protein